MLKILKNTTSLIKKKPFFSFLILCLFIFLFIYSNFFQVIEGKRGRRINIIRELKENIKKNKKLIDLNKQKIISLSSKFSKNNNPLINQNIQNTPNIPNIPNLGNLVKPGSLTALRKKD
jgi:hypothetical protein